MSETQQNPFDLFGEVPVSIREIEIWMFKVPRLPHYHRARSTYWRSWNTIDKIRRAKVAGTLGNSLQDECCEFCGQQLIPDPTPTPASPASELSILRRRIEVLEFLLIVPRPEKQKAGNLPASRLARLLPTL